MAACKLAAKGRTMADSSYNSEVDNLKTLLKMQKTGSGGSHNGIVKLDIDYIPKII